MSRYKKYLALGVLIVTQTSIRAAVPPSIVEEVVSNAAQECTRAGGLPNVDAVLTVEDLNNDGGEDWIIDLSNFRCAGMTPLNCAQRGCDLKIFLWTPSNQWRKVFDEKVQTYSNIKKYMGYSIKVRYPRSHPRCRNDRSCEYEYTFSHDEILLKK